VSITAGLPSLGGYPKGAVAGQGSDYVVQPGSTPIIMRADCEWVPAGAAFH